MDRGSMSNFLFGLGVGIGVGMLFAPNAGAETREMLASRAEEGKDYLRQRSSEWRDQASGLVERGKQVVNRQKGNLSEAVEAGKQAYRETVGQDPSGEMAR
jgi:gas vesicle protein